MGIETVLIVGLMVLLVLGALAAVVLVGRAGGDPRPGLEANPMAPRVVFEVHAGEEQTLIHLMRSLRLPSGKQDVAYGEIYLAGSAGTTMKLATRSEIGRGFDGEIRVHRARRSSVAEYFVLRLPGDESVVARIADLDEAIVRAAHALDPQATVRRAGEHRRPHHRPGMPAAG